MNKTDIPQAEYSFSGNEVAVIVESALESLLWSEGEIYAEDEKPTGKSWDDVYVESDATPELRAAITAEVNALDAPDSEDSGAVVQQWAAHEYVKALGLEKFGHDMTLTRNGCGAGFWDRGIGAIGDVLTEWAKHLGTLHVFHGAQSTKPEEWQGMFHAE